MNRRFFFFLLFVVGAALLGRFVTVRRPAPMTGVNEAVRIALEPFCIDRPNPEKHRVLVVGWDGASFRFIDSLLEAGRLPQVEALLSRGVHAALESTIIPISSAAWASAVTGKNPARTGVFSFFETVPGTYDIRVISSLNRRATPVWQILNHHGLRAIVFGTPGTYPPERIRDVMVAGMLSPEMSDYAWPPGLTAALRQIGFVPDLGIWRESRPLTHNRLYKQLEIRRQALLTLLSGNDWDLAFLVFKSLDVVQHKGIDGPAKERVEELYTKLDRLLGEFIHLVGPKTDIIVLSDHGFQSYPMLFYVGGWLVETGFAVLKEGEGVSKPDGTGPIFLVAPSRHSYEMGLLDLSRTVAFSGPAEGNFGSIRINLAGREPKGIVAPEQYEEFVERILDRLGAARISGSEEFFVKRAMRARDLYDGPYVGELPDILFEVVDDARVWPLMNLPSVLRLKSPAADHELDGVFIAAGPSFAHLPERSRASIVDITPTLLHIMDLPILDDMDGEVLIDFLKTGREIRIEAEPATWQETGGTATYTKEELEELEERLRSLAYTR